MCFKELHLNINKQIMQAGLVRTDGRHCKTIQNIFIQFE